MRQWDKSKPPSGPWELNKDSIQAQGLVAWWSFDGPDGCDALWDMSGVTNAHAANAGTVTAGWTRNRFGHKALKFNGTNTAYNTAAGLFNFTKTSKFMVTWVGDFGTRGPVTCWDVAVTAGWHIDQDRAAGFTSMTMASATGANYFGRDIGSPGNDSVIRPKAMVYDGSAASTGINFYVDGVIANGAGFSAGTGDPGVLVDSGIYIGKRTHSPGYFTTSTLADIRIYNTNNKAAEIAQGIADPGSRFELWYPLRSRKWFSVASSGIYAVDVAEAIASADAPSAALIANAVISEAMAAADATLAAMIAAVSAAESITATDAPAAAMTASATVSESASLTDALNGSVNLLTGSVAESLTLTDAPTVTLTAAVALAEAVSLLDALTGSGNQIWTGAIVEAASASDAWAATLNSGVFVTDDNFLIKLPAGGFIVARPRDNWTVKS